MSIRLTYQWLRDAVAIVGATESSYMLSSADVGHMIACDETATNAAGSTTTRTPAVGPITAAPTPPSPPPSPPPPPSGPTRFDEFYPEGFELPTNQASRSYSLPSKPAKAISFAAASLVDPHTGARMYRVTDYANDGLGAATRARHFYARRKAIVCDGSAMVVWVSHGAWYLYSLADDATTFEKVAQPGSGDGRLPGFAGSCEVILHPTDPAKIIRTDNNGGMAYTVYDTTTHSSSTLFDLTGKLPAGYEDATRVWTRGEGHPSDDLRYWCLQADDESFNIAGGIVCYDREGDAVIGNISSSTRPNHCSMSRDGSTMVVSWEDSKGTRAFPRNYSGPDTGGVQLLAGSEHSGIGRAADGTNYLVYFDYTNERVRAVKLDGTGRIDLMPTYPASGESFAGHVCGFAPDGWVLMSTYASYADYGETTPAPTARWNYERIFFCEIAENPEVRIVGEHHSRRFGDDDDVTYFAEPHAVYGAGMVATASNWIGRAGTAEEVEPDEYLYALPSTALGG